MPSMIGKKSKQDNLIENLNHEFNTIMKVHNLPPGDFPDLTKFKERLALHDFSKFPKIKPKLIGAMDEALSADIPKLVKMFPLEQLPPSQTNPFEFASNYEKSVASLGIKTEEKESYSNVFHTLNLTNGRAPGVEVRKVMMESGLPKDTLFENLELM